MIILEGGQQESANKNTGAKEQFLEAPTVRHALATVDQEFATVEGFKTLDNWKTGVADKNIFPLYEIEELANADTEDTFFEGNSKYKTSNGQKIRTFNLMVGVNSHNAVKSYNGKKMRVYEFTDAQEIKGVTPDGVKVRGQLATITVGKRVDALNDKPAYTPVTVTYADYNEFEDNGVIVKPDWSHIELNGIFDVKLTQVSATSSSIKFKVNAYIGNTPITSLETGDVLLLSPTGTAVTHTFVGADANGVYTLNGTGFLANSTVTLNGVATQTEGSYEAIAPLTVEI